jgi:hypothetical protein
VIQAVDPQDMEAVDPQDISQPWWLLFMEVLENVIRFSTPDYPSDIATEPYEVVYG